MQSVTSGENSPAVRGPRGLPYQVALVFSPVFVELNECWRTSRCYPPPVHGMRRAPTPTSTACVCQRPCNPYKSAFGRSGRSTQQASGQTSRTFELVQCSWFIFCGLAPLLLVSARSAFFSDAGIGRRLDFGPPRFWVPLKSVMGGTLTCAVNAGMRWRRLGRDARDWESGGVRKARCAREDVDERYWKAKQNENIWDPQLGFLYIHICYQ